MYEKKRMKSSVSPIPQHLYPGKTTANVLTHRLPDLSLHPPSLSTFCGWI